MNRKILIMGLPRSGKTTLAKALAPLLYAVHFNADEVRTNINKDLGFSEADRIEQATRMGWLCDRVVAAGHNAIADFVCPTPATRKAFGANYTVYVDTGKDCQFEDTKAMFVEPNPWDYRITEQDGAHGTIDAKQIAQSISPWLGLDWRKPTALFIGRYQPFHEGHRALVLEGIERVGQACIAVRDTEGIDDKNPFGFEAIRRRIATVMYDEIKNIAIIQVPNISHVFYGRDVGYRIERIDLSADLQRVSASAIREQMKI